MKSGNISNAVLNRSVYGLLGKGKKNAKTALTVGREAVAYDLSLQGNWSVTKAPDAGQTEEKLLAMSAIGTGFYGVYRAADRLWAAGGEPMSTALQIFFPENWEEKELKALVRRLKAQCEELELPVTAVMVHVNQALDKPLVSVTCSGRVLREMSPDKAAPGEFVIVTKWIGIEGMRILGERYQDKICGHFTEHFYEQAMGRQQDLSIGTEACIVREAGVKSVYAAGEGGIFGALWNLSEASGVGLELDFKKIPVKQEIIEVCELLERNPYEMSSFGCLLMTSAHGYDIVKLLNAQGIPAGIIGKTTDSQDKVIHNGEEIRFLEPPKQDEIYK